MKSKALLTTLLLTICTISFSQDYMDEIALKACECLHSVSDTLDTERYNMELGFCMIDAAMPYKKQIKKDYKIDLDRIDGQAGNELGQVIGLRMASVCPDAIMQVASKVNGEEEAEELEDVVVGYITKIDENKFIVFSLTDEKGKIMKFYWLTFIEADLNFELTSQYKSLMNKMVQITYLPQEFFDYRIEEYRPFNIIQKLQIVQ